MQRDLVDRIKDIIEWSKLSQRQFGTTIGFSHHTLNNYVLRKRETIDSSLLEKILLSFDDINAEWLLTGRGAMLKEGVDKSLNEVKEDRVVYGNANYGVLIKQQSEFINQQKEIIDSLKEEITRLRDQAFTNSSNTKDAAECADASGF